MSKKGYLCVFSLVISFLICGINSTYAQVPSEDDTLRASSIISVPAETTIAVDFWLKLKTEHAVQSLSIPLKFRSAEGDTPLKIECDSIHWSDWFWDNVPFLFTGQYGEKYVDSVQKELILSALWGVPPGSLYLPAGEGVLFTLYFTTGLYWDPSKTVKVDTFSREYPSSYFELGDTMIISQRFIPVYEPAYLGPTWIREVYEENINSPQDFILGQNYPNPFNPTTVIRFALPEDSWVKVEVFNILGQKIITLVNEYLTAGYKETGWDGTDSRGNDVASGIYFYKISANNFTDIKKMVLLK